MHSTGMHICTSELLILPGAQVSLDSQVASIGDEAPNGPSAITSITTTPDGEYLLANFKDHTTHLWRLGPIARRIMRPLPDGRSSHPYGIAPRGETCPSLVMCMCL